MRGCDGVRRWCGVDSRYSTFAIIPLWEARLLLSDFGPFVRLEREASVERVARLRAIAESASLLWMEPDLLETIVTGLIVERTHLHSDYGEQTVGEFLFRVADMTG